MTYNYTQDLSTENFEIMIDPANDYGYFEHHKEGEDCAGGLWFEHNELVDYDGVYELPEEVEDALHAAGYVIEWREE